SAAPQPPSPRNSTATSWLAARSPPMPDPLRHAFRNADGLDWNWLDNQLGDSGHGRFWKATFAEVRAALRSQSPEPSSSEVRVKPLEWVLQEDRDPEYPRWNAEAIGTRYSVFKAWWGTQNKWGFVSCDGFHDTA